MSDTIKKLVIAIIVCQLAGLIGGFFTSQSIPTWYKDLKKPDFNPPNWVFGPVWTVLYLLMGISLFLVWKSGGPGQEKTMGMIVFFIQLGLNILWSFLFFYLRSPMAGFIEIIVLWIFILMTMILFYPLSKLGSLLMIPYILWVSFAGALNYFLWYLNKG